MTAVDSVLTVEDCLRAVRELRAELAELRQQLAQEVRTGRLVVVDADGVERIHTEIHDANKWAALRVTWNTDDNDGAGATLTAGVDGGDGAHGLIVGTADVYVSAGGNIVSQLSAINQIGQHNVEHLDGSVIVSRYAYRHDRNHGDEQRLEVEPDRIKTVMGNETARAVFQYMPT